jgi:predicted lysophospholipase L1 biosynthesis ABC-type transport system permease subunit
MRWFGAPREVAERGAWARRHPFRASAAYALLVAAVLNALAFMRIQEIGLSVALFGASFVLLFLVGLAGIGLGARALSRSRGTDPTTP